MGNCNSGSVAGATHELTVTTGDRKGAGAKNVNVFIKFTDEAGRVSDEIEVTNFWKNDFKQGKTEKFQLVLNELTRITDINVRRDQTGKDDSWFIELMEVRNISKGLPSMFPYNRWLHAEHDLSLSEYDSTLPQQGKYPDQREKELRKKREIYLLAEKYIGVPPQVKSLPEDEKFSNAYMWDIAKVLLEMKAKTVFIDLTTKEFQSLKDIESVYQGILDVPTGLKCWKSDVEFGNQRLIGCNPVMIELCKEIPAHLAVTSELVEPFLEGKTLEKAMANKNIYIIDLSYLASIEYAGSTQIPGPTCLLYVRDSGDLVPIAIQLMPESAEDNPVFLPSDPKYTWIAAKMWYNLADSSHHQSATHLGLTHLLMDTVAVCTNRQLSPSHPVFRLLAPHFLYLLAINAEALVILLNPGGSVDQIMSIGRVGMVNIMKEKWAVWNAKENGNLLNDLKRRGVDDTAALPNYHYRDDAILLWNAIAKYVSEIVTNNYDTADKLTGDTEIQAWLQELSGDGNFKGLPQSFTNTTDLTEVVTMFIFISSVQHAAVNFGQYNEYAFPPNYPAALFTQRPTSKEALSEDYIVKSLPPKDKALDTMLLVTILSERATNSLGNFEVKYAYCPISQDALKRFKADLKEVSNTISQRNAKRVNKYPYLDPGAIPNAISI